MIDHMKEGLAKLIATYGRKRVLLAAALAALCVCVVVGVSLSVASGSSSIGAGHAVTDGVGTGDSTAHDRADASKPGTADGKQDAEKDAKRSEADSAKKGATSDAKTGTSDDSSKSGSMTGTDGAKSSDNTSSGTNPSGGSPGSTSTPTPPSKPAQPAPQPPPPTTITVSVYIDSSRAVSYGYPACLASQTVTLNPGASVYDALVATGVSVSGSSSYVRSIGGLGEFACGPQSGWIYLVNGSSPGYGCGSYALYGGESVTWVYTLALGNDL